MADKRLPYVVVDTCVFIDVFQKVEGRYLDALAILNGHGREHVIALPALQLLEFYSFSQKDQQQTSEKRAKEFQKADDFIASQDYLTIELSKPLVEDAVENIWGKSTVKAADAALVAAAEAIGAKYLYTYDDKLIRKCRGLDLKVQVMPPPPSPTLPIY